MRLLYTNSTVTLKRRAVSSGNKKGDSTIQSGIPAFISDTGTTADHEQTYLIMLTADDVTSPINSDTDTIYDGTSTYKVANCAKKEHHYELRVIKSI